MNALSMMATAAVLFAVAAIGGLTMAIIRFKGADRPPLTFEEVMPLLPSGVGQSLLSMTRIGLTSHQISVLFTRLLSTT